MSRNPNYVKLIQSYKWRCLRQKKIAAQPLCERCLEDDRTTLADAVHHIKPVETGLTYQEMKDLMFSFDNLMSVCNPCHSTIHKELNSFDVQTIKDNQERNTQRFIDRFFK